MDASQKPESEECNAPPIKPAKSTHFIEATTPIEPSGSPFADPPTSHNKSLLQPSDVGFGYLPDNNWRDSNFHAKEVDINEGEVKSLSPAPMTPLKSALKSPGAPRRNLNSALSPTFREEHLLEKSEDKTDKEQAKDLKVKYRVRIAKILLRGINFACSLIVVSMLATVLTIFHATKALPERNGLPAWAPNTQTWPQVTVLVIASISLAMSIVILWAYFRKGHQRAEKLAVYYTVFAVGFFIVSIFVWGIAAGLLNQSKAGGGGKDMWGWSCKDNRRRELFEDDVQYALACRLQDWTLVCAIIEIVIEAFTIAIYGIVFYRFWSKRKLRKSMAVRDRARSDLYLAQLRSQSAPNTPGFGPLSPRDGGWRPPPGHHQSAVDDPLSSAENGEAGDNNTVQYARGYAHPKPIALQPPPIRLHAPTPKTDQGEFKSAETREVVGLSSQPPRSPGSPGVPQSPGVIETMRPHVPAAPGEQEYAKVPIPGSYTSAAISPSVVPEGFGRFETTRRQE